MRDLTIATNDITREIVKPDGRFNPIITKAADSNAITFKTIDEKKMNEIVEFMPEVNRAVQAFNKQNSQTTSSLMTLGMLESGPYRTLRQILAQVEKKRNALKENIYKLEKMKIEYQELQEKISDLAADEEGNNYLKSEKVYLRMNKIAADIVDATGHIEAVLKELGAYKERYEEVRKNHNIPTDWTEEDFEKSEVEHHIKSMFRNAIRDRMAGAHNIGTMEYMEQYGVEPVLAYAMVDEFIAEIKSGMKEGKMPSVEIRYAFYDKMYDLFKDEYKKAMKRIGLDSITHADWLMKENK